jgi:hypothetical protein
MGSLSEFDNDIRFSFVHQTAGNIIPKGHTGKGGRKQGLGAELRRVSADSHLQH